MTMLNIDKKLKEDSKMVGKIERIEERVGTIEGTLRTILDESIHTNKLLQKLLEAQLPTRDDNEKGRRMSLHVSLNQVNIQLKEVVGQATKRKRISTKS